MRALCDTLLYVYGAFSSTTTLTLSPLSLSSSSSSSLSPMHPAVAGTCRRNLQAAHANVRIPVVVSSRQPQSPPLASRCCSYYWEKERDRVPRILRKLFTEGSCETTFTRDDSPTFMNVNLILCFRDSCEALYITAHRVANFILEIGYHLISFEMIEIINHASSIYFLWEWVSILRRRAYISWILFLIIFYELFMRILCHRILSSDSLRLIYLIGENNKFNVFSLFQK